MRSVSETLAIASLKKIAMPCPYSNAEKHPGMCVCRGTGKVKACATCDGSGWNRASNKPCSGCGGTGASVA